MVISCSSYSTGAVAAHLQRWRLDLGIVHTVRRDWLGMLMMADTTACDMAMEGTLTQAHVVVVARGRGRPRVVVMSDGLPHHECRCDLAAAQVMMMVWAPLRRCVRASCPAYRRAPGSRVVVHYRGRVLSALSSRARYCPLGSHWSRSPLSLVLLRVVEEARLNESGVSQEMIVSLTHHLLLLDLKVLKLLRKELLLLRGEPVQAYGVMASISQGLFRLLSRVYLRHRIELVMIKALCPLLIDWHRLCHRALYPLVDRLLVVLMMKAIWIWQLDSLLSLGT